MRFGDLTNPETLQKILPEKRARLVLFSQLATALTPYTYAPPISKRAEEAREKYRATEPDATMDALLAIWDRISGSEFTINRAEEVLFCSGLKNNESVFCFRGVQTDTYSFGSMYTRGNVQIGLWAVYPPKK